MENEADHDLQQELADTFARKINALDKWQSSMNALQLENVPKRLEDLDKAITEVKQLKLADLAGQLAQYGNQLNTLDQRLNAIPKSIPVKNRIEFDPKAKFVIRLIVSLGVIAMILAGVTVALFIEWNNSTSDQDKYEIVKGFYPAIADQIDSAYIVNRDTIMQQAEMKIEHRKLVLAAEAKARETRKESDAAQKRLQELERDTGTDRYKKPRI